MGWKRIENGHSWWMLNLMNNRVVDEKREVIGGGLRCWKEREEKEIGLGRNKRSFLSINQKKQLGSSSSVVASESQHNEVNMWIY